MNQIIAIANQKGGVAKTTTANAMIAGLVNLGYSVLGIDLDPQGNLSESFGADPYNNVTIYEVMKLNSHVTESIQHIKDRYDIISANIMLAGLDQELIQTGKEHRLKEVISSIIKKYDFIIIDTPPALGILTINAFTCANKILIPTTAGIFAAKGIQQLNNTIKNVKKYCNPKIKIEGVLLTKFNPRANISKQMRDLTEQLGTYIAAPIYKTYIRSAVAVEEAQAIHTDIFSYSKKSTVAEDYRNFLNEFLKGMGHYGQKEKSV